MLPTGQSAIERSEASRIMLSHIHRLPLRQAQGAGWLNKIAPHRGLEPSRMGFNS